MALACAMSLAWGQRKTPMRRCAAIAKRRGWEARKRARDWSSAALLRRMLLQIRHRLLKRQNHKTRDQRRVFFHPFLLADEAAVGLLKRFQFVDQLHGPVELVALR